MEENKLINTNPTKGMSEPFIITVKKITYDLILNGKVKRLRIKIKPHSYWEERLKRIGVDVADHSAELGIYKDDSVIPIIFQNGQNEIRANAFITEDIENYEVNGTRYYILHFSNIQKGE